MYYLNRQDYFSYPASLSFGNLKKKNTLNVNTHPTVFGSSLSLIIRLIYACLVGYYFVKMYTYEDIRFQSFIKSVEWSSLAVDQ